MRRFLPHFEEYKAISTSISTPKGDRDAQNHYSLDVTETQNNFLFTSPKSPCILTYHVFSNCYFIGRHGNINQFFVARHQKVHVFWHTTSFPIVFYVYMSHDHTTCITVRHAFTNIFWYIAFICMQCLALRHYLKSFILCTSCMCTLKLFHITQSVILTYVIALLTMLVITSLTILCSLW